MTIGPRRGRQWTWAPAKPKVPPKGVKDEVSTMARQLVEAELKPAYVQPPPKKPRWNYIVGIFTKWRGRYCYLMARYACPGPNAISPFFETGFARLEYLSIGTLSFMERLRMRTKRSVSDIDIDEITNLLLSFLTII